MAFSGGAFSLWFQLLPRCSWRQQLVSMAKNGLRSVTVMSKNLVFGCAALLLLAGSVVTALPTAQPRDVLIAGNHSNNSKKDHDKKHKNNGNKQGNKSKENNGVRDRGKGEGKDNAGQGKGQGHKNKK